jgi:uncharacterized damage-inducible protein DinB
MNLSDIQLLYDYNYWANELMLTTAAELSPEQFTQSMDFAWGSVRGTLIHTLDSEHLWRNLFQTSKVVERRLHEIKDFPTLESIADYWKQEEAAMRAYLNSLQDSDVEGILRYDIPEGVRERVLWHCLVHMVNHGTQHRSEIASMLTSLGHSPGGIDMTLFLNIRAGIG